MKRILLILIISIILTISLAICFWNTGVIDYTSIQSAQKMRFLQGPTNNNKHPNRKTLTQHKEEKSMPICKKDYGLTYGCKTAPHHLINFFDIGCTHCATFFQTTWPIIRQLFVETGRLRFTFSPYPIHSETLLFMTCAEKLIAVEQQILFEILMESDLSKVTAVTVIEQCMDAFHKKITTPTPDTLRTALQLTQKHEFTALPMLFLDSKQLSDEEQDNLVNFLQESLI